MKITIIEIKHLANVDLAIYTVDGVKCATFVRRGEMPTIESASAESQLIAAGGSLWSRGDKRRVYFNNGWELQGLSVRYYQTGNVAEASFNGEKISNAQARRLMDKLEKDFFFDLVKNEWSNDELGALVI